MGRAMFGNNGHAMSVCPRNQTRPSWQVFRISVMNSPTDCIFRSSCLISCLKSWCAINVFALFIVTCHRKISNRCGSGAWCTVRAGFNLLRWPQSQSWTGALAAPGHEAVSQDAHYRAPRHVCTNISSRSFRRHERTPPFRRARISAANNDPSRCYPKRTVSTLTSTRHPRSGPTVSGKGPRRR